MLSNKFLESALNNPSSIIEILKIDLESTLYNPSSILKIDKSVSSSAIFSFILTAINDSSKKHLSLLEICEESEIYDLVTEYCPLLKTFSCNKIYREDSAFTAGLENIAKKCKYLRHLILTVRRLPLVDNVDDYLLNMVVKFKNLTSLSLRTSAVSVKRSLYVKRNKIIHPSMTDLSQEAQENSSFFKVVKTCQQIEVFKIVDIDWLDLRIVPECVLACISSWANLKELHLVNVPTIGKGWFLPVITKNCKKLETLFLSNVCNKKACTYTPALIESFKYATNLKVLSIQQNTIIWSLNFCQALENCLRLERIFIDNLLMNSDDVAHFTIMISHFKKLIAVFIKVKSLSSNCVKLVNKNLKSIQESRPSLCYDFGKYSIAMISMPTVHRDLGRYTFRTHYQFTNETPPNCHITNQ